MAFSINEETGLFPVIRLQNNETGTSAEIYSRGALLNAFTINGQEEPCNVIDGFASPQDAIDNITAGFKSARLSPFVCRITEGRYTFRQQSYLINKFFLGTEAIHGLMFDAQFTVTSKWAGENEAFVTLEFDYEKDDEGYPFTFHSKITYTLSKNNRLSISSEITNTGKSDMPLTDGWHPYFTLGGSINDLELQINADKMLAFDERLVPTGKTLENRSFSQPAIVGDTFLDNCFVLKDENKPACILKNNATGLQLTITPEENYPYLQVYTPPHRRSIAIENISGAPDAFNNSIGLIIAKPGELYTFATVYTLHLSR
ncbi:MAG TPA: aldose 1-epimerase [Chitinophagaceae bacterium]|nr:aldose 1-epimerase [Chitinophagaceae bacterium]